MPMNKSITIKPIQSTVTKLKQYGYMGETYNGLICRSLLKEIKRVEIEDKDFEGSL